MATEGEVEESSLNDIIRNFILNFKDYHGYKYREELKRIAARSKISFRINFNDIIQYNNTFAKKLYEEPKKVIPIIEEVVKEEVLNYDPDFTENRVWIRIYNSPYKVPIRNIRSEFMGKLIGVEGIVVKATSPKSKIRILKFKHLSNECNHEFFYPEWEMGDTIESPTSCPYCRKGGVFKPIMEESIVQDWQRIVIQEKPEEVPPGGIPRQIDAIVEGDLVDYSRPGDRVTAYGILSLRSENIKRGVRNVLDSHLYISDIEISQKVLEEVNITEEEEAKIKELSKDPWIHKKIISSISPVIYGNWEIKEAIALALFGGVPKLMPDGTKIRGDIHVLIIGDPGTAKSQMLQFAARVSPRAVYTTGKGSTAAGLTAAVVREKITGDFVLEAGALVLADGGIAVIDEIDKMREEDRVAIHEAMEQQTVSIAKAGIVARLNARATIIAAGNPKLGRYIPERTISENINLPITILSRFDLIFILRDEPNSIKDRELAQHILISHSGGNEISPPIGIDLLRKYIAYARKNTHPKITEEAAKLLENFFVDLRNKSLESPESPVAITARQLEALIRISEAYARMALRDKVTRQDAEMAINIMRIFLEKIGIDVESGKIDIDTIMVGKPKSTREKMIAILDIIDNISKTEGCAKLKKIKEEANSKGIDDVHIEDMIRRLHKEGIIRENKTDCYSKVS